MAKNLDLMLLLDIYGNMLTEKQQDTLKLYYEEDLSLGEIAEDNGITRQGVHNCVRKSEEYLIQLEEAMGLAKKFCSLQSDIDVLEQLISDSKPQNLEACEKITKIIQHIRSEL